MNFTYVARSTKADCHGRNRVGPVFPLSDGPTERHQRKLSLVLDGALLILRISRAALET